jgi:hypothetical protein
MRDPTELNPIPNRAAEAHSAELTFEAQTARGLLALEEIVPSLGLPELRDYTPEMKP